MIEINAKVLGGKPVIAGTRISVEFIRQLVDQGWSVEEILANYPSLTGDDILEAVTWTPTP